VAEHVVVLDTGRVVHSGPARALLDDRDRVHQLLGVA
jgi:branched-chain amino acid transport system ATP-binding protein